VRWQIERPVARLVSVVNASVAALARCALIVLAAVAGCAESHRLSASDIDRDRPLHTLSAAEWESLCRWSFEYTGSADLPCPDGRLLVADYDWCAGLYMMGTSVFEPECPTTVGTFLDCHGGVVDDCRSGVMTAETEAACTDLGFCDP
jgi:hypothetical protein